MLERNVNNDSVGNSEILLRRKFLLSFFYFFPSYYYFFEWLHEKETWYTKYELFFVMVKTHDAVSVFASNTVAFIP